MINSVSIEGEVTKINDSKFLFVFSIKTDKNKTFDVLCSEYAKKQARKRMQENCLVRINGELEQAISTGRVYIYAENILFLNGEENKGE